MRCHQLQCAVKQQQSNNIKQQINGFERKKYESHFVRKKERQCKEWVIHENEMKQIYENISKFLGSNQALKQTD